MLLDVSKVISMEGTEIPFTMEVVLPETVLLGEKVSFPAPATLNGHCSALGETIHLHGTLSFKAVSRCVNCLCESEQLFAVPVDAVYATQPSAADPDLYLYEGSKLDPSPMAEEMANLALPMRWLCKPDCLGLCPRCGANRNIASCSCRTEEPIINPFSALRLSEDEREV